MGEDFIFVLKSRSPIFLTALCFHFIVLFMICKEVQFGNILYMCLRDLANYIFYRHLRHGRFGFASR